jgi:hypothetical protein
MRNGHQSGQANSLVPHALKPVARVKVMSLNVPVVVDPSSTFIAQSFVADPTGGAPNSVNVSGWTSRFQGFQQYRIRSTTWEVIPMRALVGTATSSQAGGAVDVWFEDTPQIGVPSTVQDAQANRRIVLVNTDTVHRETYSTNEPQDLNLTDIDSAPSHAVGSALQLGQHCLQMYGDALTLGLTTTTESVQLFVVRCIYDLEFFGIGGA